MLRDKNEEHVWNQVGDMQQSIKKRQDKTWLGGEQEKIRLTYLGRVMIKDDGVQISTVVVPY